MQGPQVVFNTNRCGPRLVLCDRSLQQIQRVLLVPQCILRAAQSHEKRGIPMVGYHGIGIQCDGALEFVLGWRRLALRGKVGQEGSLREGLEASIRERAREIIEMVLEQEVESAPGAPAVGVWQDGTVTGTGERDGG